MNYQQLVEQIINFANRNTDDIVFVSSIPFFIDQAQQRIFREAIDIGFETLTTIGELQADDPIVKKPINWNKTVSFQVTNLETRISTFLELHSYEFCVQMWNNSNLSNVNNPPLYYCDREFSTTGNDNPNYADTNLRNTPYSAWFIAPTPKENTFQYQVTYLAYVQNINEEEQDNILTLRFPDLLFYASMCEAFSFTQENERIQIFEGLYERALKSINGQTVDRYSDRTIQRNKD